MIFTSCQENDKSKNNSSDFVCAVDEIQLAGRVVISMNYNL